MIAAIPGLGEIFVVACIAAVVVLPYWKIYSKAGFSGALSLLMLIPLLNIGMLFFLAYAEWPALKRAESAGRAQSAAPGAEGQRQLR